MLHAPTSKSKQRSGPARTNVETQREHELHPRLGESAQHEHFAGLQSTIGNQAVLRMLAAPKPQQTASNQGVLRRLPPISHTGAPAKEQQNESTVPLHIQPKLHIGSVDDPLEREADRVADTVMRMPDPTVFSASAVSSASPSVHRQCSCGGTCSKCQSEEGQEREHVHLKPTGSSQKEDAAAPPVVHQALRSPAGPLPSVIRSFMEARFGQDFRDVQVHTGQTATSAAEALFAQAFTRGNHIVFGAGRYRPESADGRRLLAHELAHTLQQRAGSNAIQQAPDKRWVNDVKAAHYRGKIMAGRITNHGLLSDDARAKMKSELQYFEGAAWDAYVGEVRPALRAVTEIDISVAEKPPEAKTEPKEKEKEMVPDPPCT